jgi:1-deoxy-D-xylulose-5-phosphate synthase
MLLLKKKQNYAVYNLRWVNPLPNTELELLLRNYKKVITMEESVKNGGIGCAINEFVRYKKIDCHIYVSAIDNKFLPAGDKQELSELAKIDVKSIFEQLESFWG